MTAYLDSPWYEGLLVGSLMVGAVRLRGVALPRRRPHVAAGVSLSLLRQPTRAVPAKRETPRGWHRGDFVCGVVARPCAPLS